MANGIPAVLALLRIDGVFDRAKRHSDVVVWSDHVHSPNVAQERFNWFGFCRDGAGRVVIARDVAGFIGFMIMLVVFLEIVFGAQPL